MLENHKVGRAVQFLRIADLNTGQERRDDKQMKMKVLTELFRPVKTRNDHRKQTGSFL